MILLKKKYNSLDIGLYEGKFKMSLKINIFVRYGRDGGNSPFHP